MSNEEHMHDSVFVPMCADFLHSGHLNILNIAASHGKVIILLMTNEAMRKYKRAPYFSYDQRKNILLALKVVETVRTIDVWSNGGQIPALCLCARR